MSVLETTVVARTKPRFRGPRLTASELGLMFRRPRNLALLGVLAAVPVGIGVGSRVAGGEAPDDAGAAIISQITGNGLMLAFAAYFLTLQFVLPLSVAIVSGDAIAGEASLGTLRYLLTAPAGRTRLLWVKFGSIIAFCVAACTVVGVSAVITGLILFPVGPLTLLSGTTVSMADGMGRVALVALYSAAGMAALGAVGLAISTFTESAIGAIAATFLIVVIGQVLAVIPALEPLRPFVLTSWWTSFDGVLRDPIAADELRQGLIVYAAYVAVAGSLAWARFTSRDVTS